MSEESRKFIEAVEHLAVEVNRTAIAHGFWESPNEGEKIALMHSELSECIETLRARDEQHGVIPPHLLAAEELADCVIRIMDFAIYKGYDLGAAIIAKAEYNKQRPYKHNKTF